MRDRDAGWLAVMIGLAGEGLLVWLLEALPLWAKLLLYVPVGLAIAFGFGLILRDALRSRRRRADAGGRAPRAAAPAKPTARAKVPPPPPRR